jgi:hypothetical protein
MSAPRDTLIRRALRRFALGSGPLKRRSDRVQMLGRIVIAASLLLAPPVAVAVATATTAHLQAVADAETAERSLVRAVLLEDAPPLNVGDYADARVRVPAVWDVADGTSRQGDVLASPLSAAGTAVRVWVDRAGDLTQPPLDRAGIPAFAYLMGALLLVGLPVATWTLYAVMCLLLDVARDRRWERDWASVEPDWHSRLL